MNIRSALAKSRPTVISATAATAMVAGLVGTAAAVSPTVQTGRTLLGGFEVVREVVLNGPSLLFTVPQDHHLTITDIIVSNIFQTPGAFQIYIGSSDCNVTAQNRTARIVGPPENNVVLAFVWGMSFDPGSIICFRNADSEALEVTIRGFRWN